MRSFLAEGTAWVQTWLGPALRIALVLLLAVIIRHLVHRLVDRIADGIAQGQAGLGRLDSRLPTATAILAGSPLLSERGEQRARTTGSVLKSLTTAVVGIITVLTVLDILGVSITPLLASAGVIGVALGLGAQALVRDIIAGLFMIVEDQYGVGDVVDLGGTGGTVEAVGLRVTRLRDAEGTVWYLRNGEITKVGNRSQGWARAVLDIGLAHGQDASQAQKVLLSVGEELRADDAWAASVSAEPQVWGVEAVTTDAVVLRLVVKTPPLRQWDVARELRRRILDRFEAEGLQIPEGLSGGVDPGAWTR